MGMNYVCYFEIIILILDGVEESKLTQGYICFGFPHRANSCVFGIDIKIEDLIAEAAHMSLLIKQTIQVFILSA